MKQPSSLYLLAGERDYRLLRGQGTTLIEIVHQTAADFPDVEDKPSGSGLEVDAHGRTERIERDRFARHVVRAVAEEWEKGGFDRIVVAAGPKMLGVLRKALPKFLLTHVAAELNKDLVKIAVHDLPPHLAEVPAL